MKVEEDPLEAIERKLFIHIGAPKTGSTAIQLALLELHSKLELNGILYPDINGEGFGWQARRGLSGGNAYRSTWDMTTPGEVLIESDARKSFTNLLEECCTRSKNFKSIILSNELLQEVASKEFFWEEISRYSENARSKVEVVLYLRDPLQMVLALYSERIKRGHSKLSLSDYLLSSFNLLPSIYQNLTSMFTYAKKYHACPLVFRYEEVSEDIQSQFINLVTNQKADSYNLSQIRTNKSLTAFELEFFRGVHSVSRELGMLLCWERIDIFLNKGINANRTVDFPHYISNESKSALENCINDLRPSFKEHLMFFDNMDFSINSSKVTTDSSETIMKSREEVYELGKFLGRSHVGGYMDWNRKNKTKPT